MKRSRGDPSDWRVRPAAPDSVPRAHKRKRYHARHYRDRAWPFYLLVGGIPLVVVLLIVGFSAVPPYTPSQAQAQPTAFVAPSRSSYEASYEAEDATHNTLGPATKVRAVAGASGGLVVTGVGHGSPAGDVTFRAVTVPVAGAYVLTVYYVTRDQATHALAMSLNGHGPATLQFPPVAAGGGIGMTRTLVQLGAGTNTISFGNSNAAAGPDLDRVTVQAR